MKPPQALSAALMLALVTFTGCDSGRDAKLQEDDRNLADVAKAQQDGLQWDLDRATAQVLSWRYYSDAPPEPTRIYEVFMRCHEEPPIHEANKKVCADLRARVVKQEAKVKVQADRGKAAW
jgi:hypothetical protein